MISDRLAVFPNLAVRSFCDSAIQLEFSRNHCLREITLADEIWHHADFANRFGVEQEQRIPQTRFFFPKGALHIDKNFPTPNLRRMLQRRRTRIRVHGRAVSDDEKRGILFLRHSKLSTFNVKRSTLNKKTRQRFIASALDIEC